MRRRGLAVQRHLQSVAGGSTDEAGIQAGNQVIRGAPPPTALIVSSSDLTPGVLSAISQAGLRVPQDLALVGVGDLSWTPTLLSPITSLIERARQMGADACRLLLRRLESDDERVPLLLEADGEPAHLSYVADLGAGCRAELRPELRDLPFQAPHALAFVGACPSRARLSPNDPVSAGRFHALGIPRACPRSDGQACTKVYRKQDMDQEQRTASVLPGNQPGGWRLYDPGPDPPLPAAG